MGESMTLEDANNAVRQAVEASLAGRTLTPAEPAEEATFTDPEPVRVQDQDKLEAAWAAVAERHKQMQRNLREPQAAEPVERRTVEVPAVVPTDGLRPGSREFLAVLEELKALHLAKTLDYGVDEDALANIRSSADVVNMPAWAGCILRMSDKMHRLKAFFRRGRTEFDGVEDTLKDLACYAAIALVLYRETRCTKVQ
jgi:hypothetical protein